MVRLAPRLGSPTGSPSAPPGLPKGEPVPPPAAGKPPAVPALAPPVTVIQPSREEKPKKETPKAAPKTAPEKPGPKVRIGKAKKPAAEGPQIRTQKVEAPQKQDISRALSEIDQELAEREKPPSAAGPEGPASSATPGSPTGTLPPGSAPGLGIPEGTITAREPGFAAYQSKVRSRIIQNWIKTHAGNETQKLSARVKVRIDNSGTVIFKNLVKGSGDASFDNSVLRAVERASPFPPPPPEAQKEALQEGFVVDFRSRVLGK